MKLSSMTTDQACDCMLALAEPVGNIVEDAKVSAALSEIFARNGEISKAELTGLALKKVLPLALREHRADVYQILSALTGKTVKEIGEQTIGQTIEDAKGVLDKDLADFFTSSAATAQSAL